MSEKKIDQMLRDMKKQNEVPKLFSAGVDDMLQRLPEQIKAKRNKKKCWIYTSVTAAALSACIIGSGFVSPVMASVLKEVPIIGSIFSNVGDPVLKEMENLGFINEMQKEATDQGITLAIQEVFFDGARLAIGYELTVPEAHENIGAIERGQGVPMQFNATVNGGDNLQYMADFEQHPVADNQYIGNIDMYLDIIGEQASPLVMQLNVEKIGQVEGKWAFQFPLENEKLINETVTVNPTVSEDLMGVNVSVEEISFTPATTQLTFKKLGQKDSLEAVNIFIFDEYGTMLGGISAGEPYVEEANGKVSMNEKASVGAMNHIPNSLKIALVERNSASLTDSKEYSFDATSGFPHIIPMGKEQSITVTDVQFEQDKTIVFFEVSGEPLLQNQYVMLEKDGITYDRTASPVGIKGTSNAYMVEYPAISDQKNVTITTTVHEADWDRQWKVVEVPLSN